VVIVVSITIPRVIADLLREKAGKLGVPIEELLLEFVTRGLDPSDVARKYIDVAAEMLGQAEDELRKGDLRQAGEKVWGAVALAVKAHAMYREGIRLESHVQLWQYKSKMAEELGDWVRGAWYAANAMHMNFYEGGADRKDVEEALEHARRLVKAVADRIYAERR